MTFPSVAATNTTNGSAASATPAVNLPGSISAGDLLIVIFRTANGASGIGWPAGWNEGFESTADASDDATAWAWRKATGSEGGTVSLTTASAKFAAVSYRITGAADPTVQPPESGTVNTEGGSPSAVPNPGNATPTGGAKDYLWIAAMGCEGEQTVPPTYPTNYSSNQLHGNSATAGAIETNVRVAAATRNLNASSEDAGAYTISAANDWTAFTIAVHPVAAFAATASLSVGPVTFSGSATFSGGTKTATAALTAPRATLAGSAEFDAPVYTGTAALTVGAAVLSGTAITVQTFTATAAMTAPRATLAGLAEFDAPVYTATAALTVGEATLAGVATFSAPVYAATASLVIGPATLAASGTFTAPVYTASASLSAPAATIASSGSFAINAFNATAALMVAPASLMASATLSVPTRNFPGLVSVARKGSLVTVERRGGKVTIQRRGLLASIDRQGATVTAARLGSLITHARKSS